jgi:hypothetical protein
MQPKILLFFCGLQFLTSCIKQPDCGKPIFIIAPIEVMEGEDLTLGVKNVLDGTNTYFYWEFPDMSAYSSTVDGMAEVSDFDPITIYKVDFRDEGNYRFKVSPGQDECDTKITSKFIKVIPKVSPCFADFSENTMLLTESFSANPFNLTLTPYVSGDTLNQDLQINLGMTGGNNFGYALNFYFDIPKPTHSSTYTMRNYYQNFSDSQIEDDPYIQVEVAFSPNNEGYDAYRLVENTQNIYVKREGNTLIFSFCDVVFTKASSNPDRTISMSGKFKITL